MSKDEISEHAVKATIGAAAGIATGMTKSLPAPHAIRAGIANPTARFFNGATRALHQHKGLSQAAGAGAVAVVGPHVAAIAIAAAPVVIATAPLALAAGAAFGLYKLFKSR